MDLAIDLWEARDARVNQMDSRGSEPFLHHSLSQDAPPIHHPRQLLDVGNYMFSLPPEDQGLPPSSMAGYDQFGPPPRDCHCMSRAPPHHKEFSPPPTPPMDPGLVPLKMPFHSSHPPLPNQWQMPMMNHWPPLPNFLPRPWEQPPAYESPSLSPSPDRSPHATPPPTPPPPNHMMMGPAPPVLHHQRAAMNRIPKKMPPGQLPRLLWNHGDILPLTPRGDPFPGHPPGHQPPPH